MYSIYCVPLYFLYPITIIKKINYRFIAKGDIKLVSKDVSLLPLNMVETLFYFYCVFKLFAD